jgi:hypothetical protein
MKIPFKSTGFVWVLIFITGLIVITHINGCTKSDTTITEQNYIEVTKTGCKTEFLISTDSSNQDCIEYSFKNNSLHIKHINAAFNCCPNKVYAVAGISNDTITITEKEVLSQPCKCNCLYDIEYNIPNIADSLYVIVINEPYIKEQSERLVFQIQPLASINGSYCKTRTTYPWGL